MADYLIDFNRGDDAAAGTLAAPWKNLSKLATLTMNNGDNVLLADDSHWMLSDRVILGTINGTRKAPCTIARQGTRGGYPTITYNIPILSGQWTYVAADNGWYYDVGFPPGVMARVLLGRSTLASYVVDFLPDAATHPPPAVPLPTRDGAFSKYNNLLYLYAPPNQDPTQYYGGVDLGPSDRGALTASNDGGFLVIDGLKFVRQGTGILVFNSSGEREIVVRNCVTFDTGPLIFANTLTGGLQHATVEDCLGEKSTCAFVHFYEGGGVQGFGRCVVQRNDFKTCNLAYPQGAIYWQVRFGSSHIRYNRIGDAKYGTEYHQNDGCCIYTEVTANNTLVYGNHLYDSICALQDNSGRKTRWTGNVIDNCYMAMKCTDESNINAVDHTFVNNTILRAGSPEPVLQGPNRPAGQGWYAYETTSPIMQLNIQNNVFVRHPQAAGTAAAIETPASAGGTINNNRAYGFSAVAENYLGGAASPTPTNSSTTDPRPYINADGSLKSEGYTLGSPNPLANAGTYIDGVRLRNGKMRPGWSPLGAYQAVVDRA